MAIRTYTPDQAAPAIERIRQATNYIFGPDSRHRTVAVEQGASVADVLLGGVGPADGGPALVVALAKYSNGKVVYETHRGSQDEYAGMTIPVPAISETEFAATELVVPQPVHGSTCIPNFVGSCVVIETSLSDGQIQVPRYIYGQTAPTGVKPLTPQMEAGTVAIVESFATSDLEAMYTGAEIQDALIALGGTANIFRDQAMNSAAQVFLP